MQTVIPPIPSIPFCRKTLRRFFRLESSNTRTPRNSKKIAPLESALPHPRTPPSLSLQIDFPTGISFSNFVPFRNVIRRELQKERQHAGRLRFPNSRRLVLEYPGGTLDIRALSARRTAVTRAICELLGVGSPVGFFTISYPVRTTFYISNVPIPPSSFKTPEDSQHIGAIDFFDRAWLEATFGERAVPLLRPLASPSAITRHLESKPVHSVPISFLIHVRDYFTELDIPKMLMIGEMSFPVTKWTPVCRMQLVFDNNLELGSLPMVLQVPKGQILDRIRAELPFSRQEKVAFLTPKGDKLCVWTPSEVTHQDLAIHTDAISRAVCHAFGWPDSQGHFTITNVQSP
ncbi:hypothetical protein DL96DRAFT_1614206, partial [Flagelloscypha sp. PMI_526]